MSREEKRSTWWGSRCRDVSGGSPFLSVSHTCKPAAGQWGRPASPQTRDAPRCPAGGRCLLLEPAPAPRPRTAKRGVPCALPGRGPRGKTVTVRALGLHPSPESETRLPFLPRNASPAPVTHQNSSDRRRNETRAPQETGFQVGGGFGDSCHFSAFPPGPARRARFPHPSVPGSQRACARTRGSSQLFPPGYAFHT